MRAAPVLSRHGNKGQGERGIYKHILLPTDGSKLSKAAMKNGIALAKAVGAELTALVVSTPLNSLIVDPSVVSGTLDQYKALVAEQTAKYLDNVRKKARAAGVDCAEFRRSLAAKP
jgi:nucleotide-binding universal stress UspA family protein